MDTDRRNSGDAAAGRSANAFGIMAPLVPLRAGDEWSTDMIPLHVTLLGNFRIGLSAIDVLAAVEEAHPASALELKGESRAMFGPDADVPVTVLARSAKLRGLHDLLLDVLVGAGAVLDLPHHAGDGYRAHVSDPSGGGILIGDPVIVDSMALVDLRPDGRVDRRRHVGVVPFAPRPPQSAQ